MREQAAFLRPTRRQGSELAAEKGSRLYASDITRAGPDAEIVLRNDTTPSLGPSCKLKRAEFKFEHNKGLLGMTLRVAKGTLSFISGQSAKLKPGAAQIETCLGWYEPLMRMTNHCDALRSFSPITPASF
jgi:hypothetical protein